MQKLFGILDGKEVYSYTITNGKFSAEIITYGATLRKLTMPDKNGKANDVVLGYNTLEEYVNNGGYLGATIGRIANRIEGGKFILNGTEYNVGLNEVKNSLHGGFKGFDKKIWRATYGEDFAILSLLSPDGEEGYPGNLNVTVTYRLTEDGLKITYLAKSDKDTILSLTNHSYFNLNGEDGADVTDTELFIDADNITPVRADLIPLGTLQSVKGTIFDFTCYKEIGKDLGSNDPFLKQFGCYDVNFALNGTGYRKVCSAQSKRSGITMETYTDQAGLQLYTASYKDGRKGKNATYYNNCAFCLETQNYPNAINCKNFPSPILKAGEEYKTTTFYKFIINKE